MKNNHTPEIRFAGFTGDWEKRKLSDIKDVRDGTHDSPKYYNEGFPLVTSKNLTENGLDMTNVSLISEEDYQSINKRSKVDIGDIIFGMIGTIGNPVIVDRENFAIKNVALIKHGGEVTNEFLIQLLKSTIFGKYIRNENAGNTQKFLGLSKIRDYQFLSPSYQEQKEIGNFFKQLDDTIVLQQQELTTLKQTKQGILQKMFPKEGESVPEVRFPRFTGDWEQCKLSEAVNVLDGDRGKNYPSNGDLLEAGHTLFLSASNITKNGFSFESNQYITEEKSSSLGNGKLELNDIVVTSRGSLGHIAWYNADVQKHIPYARINSGMLLLRSKEKVNPSFLTQFLKSPLGKKQIDLISFGSAQPQLTKKDVSNYKISIPSFDEQSIIGVFFDDMDTLITLHQRELDALKETKKAFLQKMFV
ncbi:restriction endonuclease subunit S [Bacillus sp. 95MFCvi2.1]|uniref:restriction endonuclease subunit S n=1 Tax=Bacillus sp. 95MFCvi2.1 TaxID=1151121 RepID=UPI000371B5EF|nr:restriction endonuclease subunit S [Bacillus sp. 95MFCvi2.1]